MRAVNRVSLKSEAIGLCIAPTAVSLPPIINVVRQSEPDYKPRGLANAKLKPGLY
jgi:hypothetical protein